MRRPEGPVRSAESFVGRIVEALEKFCWRLNGGLGVDWRSLMSERAVWTCWKKLPTGRTGLLGASI